MKKIILLALVIMSASLVNAQILYRISGNGLKKASYIVGTHHLCDDSFASKIPGLDKAMRETKQLYGEVVISDLMNPDTIAAMQKAMMLPDNLTIKDILDTDHFKMLNELFSSLIGVSFDNPMVYPSMGSMRPSALESQIAILMYLKDHPGAFDPNKGIDSYLQKKALQSKKKVGGLESCSFQIGIMFNSQTLENEVKSLACLLDNQEISRKQLKAITDAFNSQDAQGIVEAMNMRYGNECDEISALNTEKLLSMRNNNWLAQMPSVMQSAPTLFVVGAGHLLGDNGIITLLRNAGYNVEPVK